MSSAFMGINVSLKLKNRYSQGQLLASQVLKRHLKHYNSIKSYQTLRFKYEISSLKSYCPFLPNINLSFGGSSFAQRKLARKNLVGCAPTIGVIYGLLLFLTLFPPQSDFSRFPPGPINLLAAGLKICCSPTSQKPLYSKRQP